MPVSRRLLLFSVPLTALVCAAERVAAQAGEGPVATIRRFYDVLLGVMRQGKRISFDQRYQQLALAVTQTFDLGLMSRIALGPGWNQMNPEQQRRFSEAFARYTISTYASRFDDYAGEKFEVEPQPVNSANGTLVQSRIVKSTGEPVALNYLMRQNGANWQVVDVYLNGTVSELATRRSEYASVLQRGGAEALVQMLEARVAALRTG